MTTRDETHKDKLNLRQRDLCNESEREICNSAAIAWEPNAILHSITCRPW